MKIHNKVNNCIYGLVMLAPMVAVLSSCAYSILNKNATEQMTVTETVQPSSLNNDDVYNFSSTSIPFHNGYTSITFNELTNIKTNAPRNFYDGSFVGIISDTTFTLLYNANDKVYYDIHNYAVSFNFKYNYGNDDNYFSNYITQTINTTEHRDLRNTFYYSLEQVEEQPVFHWAKDTPFMDVYKPFTTFFSVESDTIPMLLSYWTTVSLVMFGYEVITFMITFARNLINKFEDKAGGF